MMGPFKFQRQLAGIQVLANMREPLFQLRQGVCDIVLVGKGDVAPHGIWTRRNASHLAQGAPPSFKQRSVFAVLIDQRSRQSGGDELRHATCEAIDVGALERYARPLPLMHEYDQLLTAGGAR